MLTIYKYLLKPGLSKIEMPIGAEILHVAEQNRELCLWARLHLEERRPKEIRKFYAAMTGEADVLGSYIGTVLTWDGFVFHFFDVSV